jgi:uncharacterized protein (TIGR02147 family)
MNKSLKPPVVQNYTQITQYLNDYFLYRKSLDRTFSFDIWGAELGFKSRSFMRMVTHGERNITLKVSQVLSDKLNLTPEQSEYFSLLIQYGNAKTSSQRKIYLDKMMEYTETENDTLEIKDYERFLASPHLSQLYLLISFTDFVATESQLKKLLNMKLIDLKKSLKTLEKMGMIKSKIQNFEKIWATQTKSFKVPGKPQDKSILAFHQYSLKEASRVLKTDQAFRHFRSIYFSVDENATDELKQEVETFLTKMKRKYEGGSLNKKRLVKLNLQAYPVSQVYTK